MCAEVMKEFAIAIALAAAVGIWMSRRTDTWIPASWKPESRGGVQFTDAYDKTYPKHAERVHAACDEFNHVYQQTFSYRETVEKPAGSLDLVRALYSAREDALAALGDVRMRLPNDLEAEKEFVRAYEDLDRHMNEYTTDAKTRTGVFVHPGPLSSAYQAKYYRAANDIVK
jgi:hypothetical protein